VNRRDREVLHGFDAISNARQETGGGGCVSRRQPDQPRISKCGVMGVEPGGLRADLDAYLDRARLRPGAVRGVRTSKGHYETHERYARSVDGNVLGLAV
jgi:hypothetical protein